MNVLLRPREGREIRGDEQRDALRRGGELFETGKI